MTDISGKRYNLDNFEAPFREFLQNHARAGQAPPLQSNSIKNYLSDLRHFWGWFTFYLHSNQARAGQAPPLQENPLSLASMIDFEAVSSYKTYLESNALPSKTINRRLSTLRKFCTFCIQQNWMKENPAKKVTNVGAVQSLSLRGAATKPGDEAISSSEIATLPTVARNDMIADFKQYLLSEKADLKNVDLIMEDVNEFMMQAVIPAEAGIQTKITKLKL